MTTKYGYNSDPVLCSECDKVICPSRRCKHPPSGIICRIPCDTCHEKNPLERAFRRLNERISPRERRAVQEYKNALTCFMQMMNESFKSKDGISQSEINDFMKLLDKMPFLEGEIDTLPSE